MLRIAKLSSLILGALLLVTVAKADNHGGKSHVDISGTIDVNFNFNNTSKGNSSAGNGLANDDLSVNMAQLVVAGSAKHVDYYLDFLYGATGFNGTTGSESAGNSGSLAQAYLTTHVNDQVSVTAGRMATNVGFEGTYAKDNWNYSRSLAFRFGSPFFHEGIAVRYNHNSGFGAGLFLYDGNDSIGTNSNGSNDDANSLQLSYGMDKWAVVFNHYMSKDGATGTNRQVINNLNASYDLNSKLSLAFSALMGEGDDQNDTDEWTSYALYAKYMLNKKYSVALRYEMFEQENGDVTGLGAPADQEFTGITLTGAYYCDSGSEMRLELSQTTADDKIFPDDDGVASQEDAQTNITVAWIHNF